MIMHNIIIIIILSKINIFAQVSETVELIDLSDAQLRQRRVPAIRSRVNIIIIHLNNNKLRCMETALHATLSKGKYRCGFCDREAILGY